MIIIPGKVNSANRLLNRRNLGITFTLRWMSLWEKMRNLMPQARVVVRTSFAGR